MLESSNEFLPVMNLRFEITNWMQKERDEKSKVRKFGILGEQSKILVSHSFFDYH